MDKLYLNDHGSDIICFVGDSKANAVRFPAHKCVLMMVSPAFEAMLGENNFVESKSGEVLFTDITPNAFKAFLFFAYTGRLRNHNVTEIPDILYVAKKYLIDDLTNACLRYLGSKEITEDNFWSFFSISEHLTDGIVLDINKFLNDNENAVILLQHVEFENLSHSLLSAFIENDFLIVENELEIFNAVANWAKIECCRQKLAVNPHNQRRVLGDIIYKIRYLSMRRDDLRNGPIKSKILNAEEGQMLLQKQINKPINLPPPWDQLLQTEPRKRVFQNLTCLFSKSSVFDPVDTNHCQWHSSILVAANDIVFGSVLIRFLPKDCEVNLTCNVRDLHGRVIKEWDSIESFDNNNEVFICIRKTIFLKAYTCYIFNVHCTKGAISSKRFNSKVISEIGGWREILCVGGYSEESCDVFESTEFWQRNFGHVRSSEHFRCLNSTIFCNISFEIIF